MASVFADDINWIRKEILCSYNELELINREKEKNLLIYRLRWYELIINFK